MIPEPCVANPLSPPERGEFINFEDEDEDEDERLNGIPNDLQRASVIVTHSGLVNSHSPDRMRQKVATMCPAFTSLSSGCR